MHSQARHSRLKRIPKFHSGLSLGFGISLHLPASLHDVLVAEIAALCAVGCIAAVFIHEPNGQALMGNGMYLRLERVSELHSWVGFSFGDWFAFDRDSGYCKEWDQGHDCREIKCEAHGLGF
jgi:hypothetical protein